MDRPPRARGLHLLHRLHDPVPTTTPTKRQPHQPPLNHPLRAHLTNRPYPLKRQFHPFATNTSLSPTLHPPPPIRLLLRLSNPHPPPSPPHNPSALRRRPSRNLSGRDHLTRPSSRARNPPHPVPSHSFRIPRPHPHFLLPKTALTRDLLARRPRRRRNGPFTEARPAEPRGQSGSGARAEEC